LKLRKKSEKEKTETEKKRMETRNEGQGTKIARIKRKEGVIYIASCAAINDEVK
jgi:hypothetical protein